MTCLIGTDIGTSSAKSVIFDQNGAIVSQSAREYEYDVPAAGYAEQDPDVWWEAAAWSIREAMAKSGAKKEDIACLGLSGQMHGMVPLDAGGKPVRKTIIHCDVRASETVRYVCGLFGRENFYSVTYNPAFSGFQLISLVWLRENEPANFEKIASVVCPKDYVRLRMTGETGVEATDASGTLAYDMKAQGWSKELLGALSIPMSIFPPVIGLPHETAGRFGAAAAEKCGLAPGTPVAYGGADQAMFSIGNGLFKKNTLLATIGSSGQALMLIDRLVKNPAMNTHVFRHIERDTWYGMSACLHAGLALNWFRRTMSPGESYDDFSTMAAVIKPCSEGLAFFPAMAGERTPHTDMKTRAAFVGLTNAHTKAHFARAIMEGVTMEMKAGIDVLEGLFGHPVKLICAGGGVRSAVWRQIQADIYGRDIFVSRTPEQGCLGAAIAAGVAAGMFRDIEEGFRAMQRKEEMTVSPIPENVEKYAEFYSEVFSGIYPNNKELFHNSWKY
ncbi:MAG: xylulokinase [Synergistaceae bacterium]|jgi:xylulokinase|nr:xylulokinase [Synergistaceae bacterium]